MSFILCEICLVPAEPWRLKARDLSAFYALNPTAFEGIQQDAPAWLCVFCWTRVCQCVHFIDTAITSRMFLSAKNRLAAIPSTDVHTYEVHSLPYWEVGLKPATDSKIRNKRKEKKRKSQRYATKVLKEKILTELETANTHTPDTSSERLSSFANSTDVHTHVVKTSPCFEVDLELTNDSKTKIEGKEKKMDPNEYATNILKEVLLNLETANTHALDAPSNRSSSFVNNIFLPPNSVTQEYYDHNSDPCVIQDELDFVIPEKKNLTPVEKMKEQSNFTVKDTGESEFLRFLKAQQKPKKIYRYSASSFFSNVTLPPIQIKEECDDSMKLVEELDLIDAAEKVHMSIEAVKEEPFETKNTKESIISIEAKAPCKDIGAKLRKKRRREEENAINDRPVEDIQMLLEEVKEEPFEAFNVTENNEESIIFHEVIDSSKAVDAHFRTVRNNQIGNITDIVPKFIDNMAAPKKTPVLGENQRPVEDLSVGSLHHSSYL